VKRGGRGSSLLALLSSSVSSIACEGRVAETQAAAESLISYLVRLIPLRMPIAKDEDIASVVASEVSYCVVPINDFGWTATLDSGFVSPVGEGNPYPYSFLPLRRIRIEAAISGISKDNGLSGSD